MNKSIFFAILSIFLVGCGSAKTTYITYDKKSLHVKKEITPQKELTSGIIKGEITFLDFDKTRKVWVYEVKGKDTTNAKLPFMRFYSLDKVAQKGAGIYAVVKNKILKEYYLLEVPQIIKKEKVVKKTKIIKKATKVKKTKKVNKRTKGRKTPSIGVPETESIDL